MNKFEVGDRVRILDGRNIPDIHPMWLAGMNEFIGEVRTVECVNSCGYGLSNIGYFFAEEWLAPADDFTKADLKEFDIVEFRNGRQALITMDIIFGRLGIGGYFVDTWDDDLKDNTGLPQYDIMKVYRPIGILPLDKSKWKGLPLIYKRTEVKEMTVEEISKALGYEVKVVK